MTVRAGPVALVGLPGAGKTTVAALLAARLGWRCADTDAEVAALTGRSPAAIIRADGEALFRELERRSLETILAGPSETVVACGGGLPAHAPSRRLLDAGATAVWLDAPDAVLLERLGAGPERPLLEGDPAERLRTLRDERAAAYAVAAARVSSRGSPEQTAAAVAALLDGIQIVRARSGPYPVVVRAGAAGDLAAVLPHSAGRVALVTDQAVRTQARRVAAQLRRDGLAVSIIALRGGEHLKTWAAAGRLLARLGAARIRRRDCVVVLGGGSVGDLAGFAAATHLRGVAWVNIPTTLLAMVDSAIGGKTGVNLGGGKNLAGALWQPRAVLCDPDLLAGLPDREFRAALAEVVKYAMVDPAGPGPLLDAALPALLRRDPAVLAEVISRSVASKAAVVEADEREAGVRAVLNYGHTAGHAFEAAAGLRARLNHGEAVAAGMRVAGALSVTRLGCPATDIAWQDELLTRCGLGSVPALPLRRVLRAIDADKKQTGQGTGWVLLERRGSPRYGQAVPEAIVEAQLRAVLPS